MVEVFDDRVEIYNPGGLMKPLTPETFGRRSVLRNPLIASLFLRIEFIEQMGTGVRRINETLAEFDCPPVEFEYEPFFTVIFRYSENRVQSKGPVTPEVTPQVEDAILTSKTGQTPQVGDGTGTKSGPVEGPVTPQVTPQVEDGTGTKSELGKDQVGAKPLASKTDPTPEVAPEVVSENGTKSSHSTPEVTSEVKDGIGTKSRSERDQVKTGSPPQKGRLSHVVAGIGTKSRSERDQVEVIRNFHGEIGIMELMEIVGRSNRTKFRNKVLNHLLNEKLIEMTIPDKPNSRLQKYRLTQKGEKLKNEMRITNEQLPTRI